MSNSLILLLDAVGVTAFLLGAGLAVKTYRRTKGVTRYWLAITVTGLLGALSAACVLDEVAKTMVFGPLHNYHLAYPALAVTVFTASGAALLQNQLTNALVSGGECK